MKPLMIAVLEHNQKLEQIVERLSETINDLQLSIRYLLFDLEATKREKQQLREMLKSQE